MPENTLERALLATPPDRLAHRPFPELARAIRSQSGLILEEWRGRTLFSLPELGHLTVKEFQDDIARILAAMADTLESNDPPDLRRLIQTAPAHGFQRFMQEYDLADLFAEERVLRRVIVTRVEEALGRQCRPDEGAALHSMIDIMLQQGVVALVQRQKQELRHASEVQLKYLSFLSHDLTNNFLVIASNLEMLQGEIARLPEMRHAAEIMNASLAIIRRTRDGMRRLLEHERLRNSNARPGVSPVNLLEVVEPVITLATSDAPGKGLRIEIDVNPHATARTNAELLTIILQNLVGNAIKHAAREAAPGRSGAVRIEAKREGSRGEDPWVVAVIDDGPGIPKDQLERLFNAFEQLPQPGEEGGFGLGLAIASQAARLLDTTIEVETHLGRGSRFSFRLPGSPSQLDAA